MRLAGSAVADCDNVFATGRVLGTGEFQDEGLVERRNRREVEAVEAFDGREPRFLDPTLHHALNGGRLNRCEGVQCRSF